MAAVRDGSLAARARWPRALRAACLAVTAALAVTACGGRGTSGPAGASAATSAASLSASSAAAAAAATAASIRRGEQVAMGTAPCARAGSCFACSTCHGASGQGSAVALQPRLAGQISDYLFRSLRNFASGSRENPTMQQIASGLTDEQMRDVAAYYASLPPDGREATQPVAASERQSGHEQPSREQAAADVIAQGRRLAAMGSASAGLPACAMCHGPNGAGQSPLYPALAGQYPAYLEQQLRAFKEGKRRSEEASLMRPVAERLSGEQMHAVALYYGSLPPGGSRSR